MPIGAARATLLARSAAVPPPPPLGTWSFLPLATANDLKVNGTTLSTFTSDTVSPTAGAEIFFFCETRRDATRTHTSVTSTFATEAGWTQIGTIEVNSGGVYHRFTAWRAKAAASPGSGEIEIVFSGSTYQQVMGAAEIADVGSVVDVIEALENAAATSISGAFSPSITDADAVIAFYGQSGIAGSAAWGDGLTQASNSPVVQSTNLKAMLGVKNPGVAKSNTQNVTGATTEIKGLLAVAVRGAA